MRTLLKTIRTGVGRRPKMSFFLIVVVLVFVALVLWARSVRNDLLSAYKTAANTHGNAAYLVGASDNPLRRELNLRLAKSLAKETSASDRITFSNEGLEILKASERQIDEIGNTAEPEVSGLVALEHGMYSPGNILVVTRIGEVAGLAHDRLKILEDIRGLSYRANYETGKIFQHFIDEKGVLTDSYITELNNLLPEVEENFDRRQSLYIQLEAIDNKLEKKIDVLTGKGGK